MLRIGLEDGAAAVRPSGSIINAYLLALIASPPRPAGWRGGPGLIISRVLAGAALMT
jgi:hypothetical protein